MSALRQRVAVQPIDKVDFASDSGSDSGSDSFLDESHLPTFTPPQYSIKELLGCIPAHCFERSAWRSGSYALGDFLMFGSFAYAASFIDANLGFEGAALLNGWAGWTAKWAAWNVFWMLAGWNFTGIWIIAHECK
jgi:omega-6 fatty acid desaturase (delta-12 desaturase)